MTPPVTVVFVNDSGPAIAVRPQPQPVASPERATEDNPLGPVPTLGAEPEPAFFEVEPQVQPEAPLLSEAEWSEPDPASVRSTPRARRKASANRRARPSASARRRRPGHGKPRSTTRRRPS